jgi:hypothetical protein
VQYILCPGPPRTRGGGYCGSQYSRHPDMEPSADNEEPVLGLEDIPSLGKHNDTKCKAHAFRSLPSPSLGTSEKPGKMPCQSGADFNELDITGFEVN